MGKRTEKPKKEREVLKSLADLERLLPPQPGEMTKCSDKLDTPCPICEEAKKPYTGLDSASRRSNELHYAMRAIIHGHLIPPQPKDK